MSQSHFSLNTFLIKNFFHFFRDNEQGFTKEFSSLRALITHHSVMKELLPIPLNLPRQHEIHQRHDLDDLDNLWFIK